MITDILASRAYIDTGRHGTCKVSKNPVDLHPASQYIWDQLSHPGWKSRKKCKRLIQKQLDSGVLERTQRSAPCISFCRSESIVLCGLFKNYAPATTLLSPTRTHDNIKYFIDSISYAQDFSVLDWSWDSGRCHSRGQNVTMPFLKYHIWTLRYFLDTKRNFNRTSIISVLLG